MCNDEYINYFFSAQFLCTLQKKKSYVKEKNRTIVYIYDKDKITPAVFGRVWTLGDWPKARIHPRVLQCRWDDFTARIYTVYGRSVLVIVRQVNASSDMRRAARISMYRGITHLRQIISSLNYIFPRRVAVGARVYFAFTSSIDENKNRISRPFSAVSLKRFLDCVLLYANHHCRPSRIFTQVAGKMRVRQEWMFFFNSHSLKILSTEYPREIDY